MSATTLEMTAKEAMQPLPPLVSLKRSAAEALEIMQSANSEFLPVVAPETERFMGVVLRKGLEHGCERMGHIPAECPLLSHLMADAEFCFKDEPVEPLLDETAGRSELVAGLRDRSIRKRLSVPIIVVDERKVPIGMIPRSAA